MNKLVSESSTLFYEVPLAMLRHTLVLKNRDLVLRHYGTYSTNLGRFKDLSNYESHQDGAAFSMLYLHRFILHADFMLDINFCLALFLHLEH